MCTSSSPSLQMGRCLMDRNVCVVLFAAVASRKEIFTTVIPEQWAGSKTELKSQELTDT